MKRALIVAVILAFACSGCMSGNVSVSDANGGNSVPSPAEKPGVGHTEGASMNGDLSVDAAEAKTVYFESIQLGTDGQLGSMTGMGFLSIQAQTDTPFEFEMSSPAYWKPVVVVGGDEQVASIQSTSTGAYELKVLDPSSMETRVLMGVPKAESYALYPDLGHAASRPLLAGIDAGGTLFVQSSSASVEQGKTGFGQGAQVAWVGGDRSIEVTDPASGTISIFSAANPKIAAATFKGDVLSASPSGKSYVLFSGGKLSLIDVASGKSRVFQVSVSSFQQPGWDGEDRVAFVDASSSGLQVDVLQVSTGQIVTQYPLNGGAITGSVCPTWVMGQLFFAGVDAQGLSVIWKADGSSPEATEFAVPQDSEQAYQCPKGVLE